MRRWTAGDHTGVVVSYLAANAYDSIPRVLPQEVALVSRLDRRIHVGESVPVVAWGRCYVGSQHKNVSAGKVALGRSEYL